MREYMSGHDVATRIDMNTGELTIKGHFASPERIEAFKAYVEGDTTYAPPWPLPNVWLGVSVENQHWLGPRVAALADTPAAVRFVSVEPMLGFVDFAVWQPEGICINYLKGGDFGDWQVPKIDWVICGGESGPRARPFDPDWARHLKLQCEFTDTPFFMKQLGGARPGTKLEDLPPDLRVREYPR